MKEKFPDKWEILKEPTGFLAAPSWRAIEHSDNVSNFIWESNEEYGDPYIGMLRSKIKRFKWEMILFFILVPIITFGLVIIGVIK
jgi:hypothetical protein